MLFNSFEFLVFFPTVTLLYFLLPHRWRWALLLVASCVFYMAFVPAYVLILLFTIVIDYYAGLLLASTHGRTRWLWLLASIVANVGVLAFFKYLTFIIENINAFLGIVGAAERMPMLSILLPIGLSFHTFQAMSYTIEVYRGHQQAERHFGIYALYVMFYPQLVAGPIERPQNLLWQFRERHYFDYDRVTDGLKLMGLGMFKKVLIADQVAPIVNQVYADPAAHGSVALLIGTLLFSFQIYYDFAGYSDIARGSARVMGFELMLNFDAPYFSVSVAEFWRRWHISLSSWFRDYVYVPLGGSRVLTPRRCVNVMIVFLLSGLWHGANWTYVVWGGLHGFYIVVQTLWGRMLGRERAQRAEEMSTAKAILRCLGTFMLVYLAWIFFRAATVGDAMLILQKIVVGLPGELPLLARGSLAIEFSQMRLLLAAAVICFMLTIEYLDRRKNIFERLAAWPLPVRFAVYLAMIYLPVLYGDFGSQQFIYFQF